MQAECRGDGRKAPAATRVGSGRAPRNKALLALDAIGAAGAAEVLATVVAAAKRGDMRAADILLRRVWPERRGRPVRLALPRIETAADLPAVLAAIWGALAQGELCPAEAAELARLVAACGQASAQGSAPVTVQIRGGLPEPDEG